jgi:adenosylcobinamide-GDP ribazoletransferase
MTPRADLDAAQPAERSSPTRHKTPFSPLRGLLTALQFLTRIPLPGGTYALEEAVVWLPAVGLLLGAILALADAGLRWLGVSSLLESTLLVVLLLALTGALHADGLMDTLDAVLSHATPERRLEIMRDPRAGAFGVVGLVCVVALKIAALDSLSKSALIWLAPGLGRWAIVLLATVYPYGRTDGLGAPLKAAATPKALVLASVAPVVACGLIGPTGIVGGVLAAVTALAFGRWLLRLLPGLTGDCYGATCELVETVVWLSGALLLPKLVA